MDARQERAARALRKYEDAFDQLGTLVEALTEIQNMPTAIAPSPQNLLVARLLRGIGELYRSGPPAPVDIRHACFLLANELEDGPRG